jgi:hypothetical protein
MDHVAVDEQHIGPLLDLLDNMLVPNFVKECFFHTTAKVSVLKSAGLDYFGNIVIVDFLLLVCNF